MLLGRLTDALVVLVQLFGGLSGPPSIHSGRWLVAHTLHVLGVVLGQLGLPRRSVAGLHRTGHPGLVGYLVAFVGTALFAASGPITANVAPLAPALVNPIRPAEGSPWSPSSCSRPSP